MPERSVNHATFVIEREYPAAPERVFAAFADPGKKRRWFTEERSRAEQLEMDFRVGGRERHHFSTEHGFVCTNDTVYTDIVPHHRIVFAYTMSIGDQRISSSQVTVELLPAGKLTELIFTEQAAFFEGGDGPQMREEGWRQLLERLATVV